MWKSNSAQLVRVCLQFLTDFAVELTLDTLNLVKRCFKGLKGVFVVIWFQIKKYSDYFMTGFVAIKFCNHFLLGVTLLANSLFVLEIMHSCRAEILTCNYSLYKFNH